MSKPKLRRLQRLEGTTISAVPLSLAAQTLRRISNVVQWLRTTIAGAQAINLPAATGKGGLYRIFIGITATGNKVIKTAGTDTFQGQASMAGGTPGTFATAANTNTITLNGTTQGGILGTVVEVWDVAPGVWSTQVNSIGSGVQVTPFSNT